MTNGPVLCRRANIRARKWHVQLGFVLSLVAAFAFAVFLTVVGRKQESKSPRVKLDVSALDKIDVGMTEAQVTTILGVPPGDYSTGRTRIYLYWGPGYHVLGEDPGTLKKWQFNSRGILIWFKDGKAARIHFGRAMRELNWFERILRIPMGPPYEPDE